MYLIYYIQLISDAGGWMSTRVLHVIARMNVGGTSTYLNNLVRSSQNLDIEHLIVLGSVQGDEIEDERVKTLPHIRIPNLGRKINLVADFRSWLRLIRIVKIYRPNLINSHTFKAGLITRLLPTRIPILHTYHGHLLHDPEFTYSQRKIIILIERVLSKKATALSVTGSKVQIELEESGIRNSRWFCIVPGLEELVQISKSESLARLGIEDAKDYRLIVGWHSRFAPVKNVPLVLDIASQMPDILFLLSGGGPLFETFKSDNPRNVRILGWQSPEIVFNACDVVVSTSHNEGLPFSLIEASMLGKPCIATRVGGTEEIIQNNISGFLTPPDSKSMIEKIHLLRDDLTLRENMGNQARLFALEKFGFEVFAGKYLELVREITS
jgi:glycosyltransferase involved in cell wall biosynthesis